MASPAFFGSYFVLLEQGLRFSTFNGPPTLFSPSRTLANFEPPHPAISLPLPYQAW